MGWRNFFSSCAVVSVFGSGGKQVLVLFTMNLCTQSTIQLWCCVSFLVLVGNSFWCYVCLVYNTVVWLCQFFCCGGKANLVWLFSFFILEKQLASQNIFLVKAQLSITTYLFLVFYKSTSLQSLSFLKNIETFLRKQKLVNNCSIPLRQQP